MKGSWYDKAIVYQENIQQLHTEKAIKELICNWSCSRIVKED
jgi:hypothetical protein